MPSRAALWLAAALAAALVAPGLARAQALRVALPGALVAAGFDSHLFTRFRFKTRIRLEAAEEGAEADLALLPAADAPEGARAVMTAADGTPWALAVLTETPQAGEAAAKLGDWLASASGARALEGFEIDGAPAFRAGAKREAKEVEITFEGDAARGSRLALVHCGRCHVIDKRNPFGGIGSTPSFGALRALEGWREKFAAFHMLNPHPAFTAIEGVTPPFDPQRPPPIAPMELTQEDVEAIAAFAETVPPKDLGARVRAR